MEGAHQKHDERHLGELQKIKKEVQDRDVRIQELESQPAAAQDEIAGLKTERAHLVAELGKREEEAAYKGERHHKELQRSQEERALLNRQLREDAAAHEIQKTQMKDKHLSEKLDMEGGFEFRLDELRKHGGSAAEIHRLRFEHTRDLADQERAHEGEMRRAHERHVGEKARQRTQMEDQRLSEKMNMEAGHVQQLEELRRHGGTAAEIQRLKEEHARDLDEQAELHARATGETVDAHEREQRALAEEVSQRVSENWRIRGEHRQDIEEKQAEIDDLRNQLIGRARSASAASAATSASSAVPAEAGLRRRLDEGEAKLAQMTAALEELKRKAAAPAPTGRGPPGPPGPPGAAGAAGPGIAGLAPYISRIPQMRPDFTEKPAKAAHKRKKRKSTKTSFRNAYMEARREATANLKKEKANRLAIIKKRLAKVPKKDRGSKKKELTLAVKKMWKLFKGKYPHWKKVKTLAALRKLTETVKTHRLNL